MERIQDGYWHSGGHEGVLDEHESRLGMLRRVWVDADVCVACGTCIELCPDVFKLTDDDKADARYPGGASEVAIQEVMDVCPVACIHWKSGRR